jgi:hypothetical protein
MNGDKPVVRRRADWPPLAPKARHPQVYGLGGSPCPLGSLPGLAEGEVCIEQSAASEFITDFLMGSFCFV